MADDGVKIPVEVVGAGDAQQQLAQTGKAVEQLGGAEAKAAGGLKQGEAAAGKTADAKTRLGDAAKKTTAGVVDFDGKAEKAAKTLAGLLGPQVAGVLDNILDLGAGLFKVSPLLLGLTAATAVITGIAAAFRKATEAAEKAAEATRKFAEDQRKLREQGSSEQSKVIDTLLEAGLPANLAGQVLSRRKDLLESGVSGRLARPQALFEAAGVLDGGDPQAVREFLAGIVATGGKAPELSTSRAKDEETARRLRRLGRDPAAQANLDSLIQAEQVDARIEGLGAPRVPQNPVDAAMEEFRRQFPTASPADISAAQGLSQQAAMNPDRVRDAIAARRELRRRLLHGPRTGLSPLVERMEGVDFPEVGELPSDAIEGAALHAANWRQVPGGAGARITVQQLTIDQRKVTNVETAHFGGAGRQRLFDPVWEPGPE